MLTGSVTFVIVIAWGLWVLTGNRLRRDARMNIMLTMAFVFYASQLLAWTLFPLPIDATLIEEQRALADAGFSRRGNNFVLFETLRGASMSERAFILQIVGNFLLLAPLGFLAPLIWERFAKLSSGIALVVGTTLAIEFSQLGISGLLGFTYRSFDVDDLWLNALGGSIAVVVAIALRNLLHADGPDAVPEPEAVPDVATAGEPVGRTPIGSPRTALYRSEL